MSRRWVGGEMKEIQVHTKFYIETLTERGHLEDVGMYGRIKLKLIVKK
jgi:hypothetical protein